MSVQEDSDTCHDLFSTNATKISIRKRRKVGVLAQQASRIRSRAEGMEQFVADPLVPVGAPPSSQSQRPAILHKIVPTRDVNTSSWSLSCFV